MDWSEIEEPPGSAANLAVQCMNPAYSGNINPVQAEVLIRPAAFFPGMQQREQMNHDQPP
jgi:hypothetical protein